MKKQDFFVARGILGILSSLLVFTGCMPKQQKDPDTIDTVYMHKYGPKIKTEEEWKERGATGKTVKRQKNGAVLNQSWKDGKPHGLAELTFPHSPTIEKEQFYDEGELLWERIHYSSGVPQFKIVYQPNKVRIVSSWYEDGVPRAEEEFTGHRLVSGNYFLPNQEKESEISDGQGIRTLRDGTGLLQAKEEIANGAMVLHQTFHSNGMLHLLTPYMNGKIHGVRKSFFITGEPRTFEDWSEGRQEGVTKIFRNAQVVAEIPYKKGKKEGMEVRFDQATGRVAQEVSWIDDLQHGCSKLLFDEKFVDAWYYEGKPVTKHEFQTRARNRIERRD